MKYIKQHIYLGQASDPKVIELTRKLQQLSMELDRPVSWIFKHAAEAYLEKHYGNNEKAGHD